MTGDQPPARFAHLLQPIRDLSKVWKIEIADELEKYIEEVSQLQVPNPEDGLSKVNFAEAALLIQGSCAIYSRKVELLYQLVYQALDLLAVEKGKEGGQGRKAKGAQSGLWGPIPDTEELLTIDHLIKEGRNIYLDPGAAEQRQVEQRRVPLFLMPRDQADRRKREFRISSCRVHHTGAYLLQASDAALLDRLLSQDKGLEEGEEDAPLVPAPPSEVQDLDDRLQELLRELPQGPEGPPEVGSLGPCDALAELAAPRGDAKSLMPAEALAASRPSAAADVAATASGAPRKAFQRTKDPWALLDEHASGPHKDQQLEVGRTFKRPNQKNLLLRAEGLPDLASAGELSDDALWSGACVDEAAPWLLAGHPVESLFLAVAGRLKSGSRFEAQRCGLSGAWLEFEDILVSARARRRQLRPKTGTAAPGSPRPEAQAEASDDEAWPGGAGEKGYVPPPGWPEDGGAAVVPDDPWDEKRQQVAELENMIQDAQHKYETTIRQHLQMLQKDSVDADSRRFPQLYANVRRWQDQLEPVLKEMNSRPEFDIAGYSTKLVTKMGGLQQGDQDAREAVIPFSRLVHGQPRWEVCRRFLTCLLLTNQGNTDIICNSEDERINGFGVRLLKADVAPLTLEGEAEAQASAGGAKRKGSKVVQEGAKLLALDGAQENAAKRRRRARPEEAGA